MSHISGLNTRQGAPTQLREHQVSRKCGLWVTRRFQLQSHLPEVTKQGLQKGARCRRTQSLQLECCYTSPTSQPGMLVQWLCRSALPRAAILLMSCVLRSSIYVYTCINMHTDANHKQTHQALVLLNLVHTIVS